MLPVAGGLTALLMLILTVMSSLILLVNAVFGLRVT
jgi:hypothetical protein